MSVEIKGMNVPWYPEENQQYVTVDDIQECRPEQSLISEMCDDLHILRIQNEILWKLIFKLSDKIGIYRNETSIEKWTPEQTPEPVHIKSIISNNNKQIRNLCGHVSDLEYIINRL